LYAATTTVSVGTVLLLSGFTSSLAGNFTLVDYSVTGTSSNWTLRANLNAFTSPGSETFTFYYTYI
jgi:hypothetical protein